jgi:hypothetical protein
MQSAESKTKTARRMTTPPNLLAHREILPMLIVSTNSYNVAQPRALTGAHLPECVMHPTSISRALTVQKP